MLNQENYKNSENTEIIMHFFLIFLKVLQNANRLKKKLKRELNIRMIKMKELKQNIELNTFVF